MLIWFIIQSQSSGIHVLFFNGSTFSSQFVFPRQKRDPSKLQTIVSTKSAGMHHLAPLLTLFFSAVLKYKFKLHQNAHLGVFVFKMFSVVLKYHNILHQNASLKVIIFKKRICGSNISFQIALECAHWRPCFQNVLGSSKLSFYIALL